MRTGRGEGGDCTLPVSSDGERGGGECTLPVFSDEERGGGDCTLPVSRHSLSQITANPIGTSHWAGGGFLLHTLMDITTTDSSPVHRIVVLLYLYVACRVFSELDISLDETQSSAFKQEHRTATVDNYSIC